MNDYFRMELNHIYHSDWIEAANRLPAGCVQCVITSPPYWGQRDYGVEGQLGLEKTFEEHIEKLVVGFREIRRILRDDGVMFLNYSDKYASMKGTCRNPGGGTESFQNKQKQADAFPLDRGNKSDFSGTGVKQGDLIGLAWRLALALQANGWILRSDIIWAKAVSFNDKYSGSTMPESVNGTRWERCRVKIKDYKPTRSTKQSHHENPTIAGFNDRYFDAAGPQYKDCPGCPKCEKNGGYVLRRGSWRPTRAHEYVFQFVKQIPYYCDMEAVREPHCDINRPNGFKGKDGIGERKINSGWSGGEVSLDKHRAYNPSGRNLRDVWTINPQPYPEAHYATFPEALVEPCIKVGTSEKGCCPQCGAPWARIINSKPIKRKRPSDRTDRHNQEGMNSCGNTVAGVETITLGWRPTCECNAGNPVPCVVYDPFMGSGTVAAVAARLGRNYIGSELNEDYLKQQAEKRIYQAETGLTKHEINQGQQILFSPRGF